MASDLPEYYFRVRENGAAVFRVDAENRQRRIEMDQIAVVNIRNGEIKPQGDRVLSDGDLERIRQWMTERAQVLAQAVALEWDAQVRRQVRAQVWN